MEQKVWRCSLFVLACPVHGICVYANLKVAYLTHLFSQTLTLAQNGLDLSFERAHRTNFINSNENVCKNLNKLTKTSRWYGNGWVLKEPGGGQMDVEIGWLSS